MRAISHFCNRTAFLIICCILVSCGDATVTSVNWTGTTYYVDATNGNDNNSGISQATPWKTIAKVNSSRSFQPGDSILFKRGDVWREMLIPPSSGSPGNPITFGAYGSGTNPIISGAIIPTSGQWTNDPPESNVWRATVTTHPYRVTFNGVAGTDKGSIPTTTYEWNWANDIVQVWSVGNPATTYTDPGVEVDFYYAPLSISKSYITVDGLTVERAIGAAIGIWAAATNGNITIQNCTTRYAAVAGIQAYQNTGGNINITNNTAYSSLVGIYMNDSPATLGNENYVQNNHVYGNFQDGILTQTTDTYLIIQNNDVHDTGVDLTQGVAGIRVWGQNIIVRYNKVYNTKGVSVDGGGILNEWQANGNQYYYNVVYNNQGYGIATNRAANISIFNNTVYGNSTGGYVSGEIMANDYITPPNEQVPSNILIKNNIGFATNPQADAMAIQIGDGIAASKGLSITNNLWWKASGNLFNAGGVKSADLDAWNALEYVGTDKKADPLMVSATDFHLTASSTCIDQGADVSLVRDFSGNLVPYGSLPDIGAFEYRPFSVSLAVGSQTITIGSGSNTISW